MYKNEVGRRGRENGERIRCWVIRRGGEKWVRSMLEEIRRDGK